MGDEPKVKVSVDLEHLFNKAVWAICLCLCGFGVKKVNDVSNNIAELNKNVALIIYSNQEDKESIKDHEQRIRDLEKRKTHAPL
jgi:hypothetical protein